MIRGMTTVALGLLQALHERGLNLGFTKPVGQRHEVVDGVPTDEDALRRGRRLGRPHSRCSAALGPAC
jgi:dethiobiotin synthetase